MEKGDDKLHRLYINIEDNRAGALNTVYITLKDNKVHFDGKMLLLKLSVQRLRILLLNINNLLSLILWHKRRLVKNEYSR